MPRRTLDTAELYDAARWELLRAGYFESRGDHYRGQVQECRMLADQYSRTLQEREQG